MFYIIFLVEKYFVIQNHKKYKYLNKINIIEERIL